MRTLHFSQMTVYISKIWR